MSFADLKKQSSLGSLTAKLVKEVEKVNNTGGGSDERLWKPEMDKTGNGFAVIRFLPAPENEDLPWVKLYSHAFQGPGGWYIENSLTTLNQKDPVSEYNRELWNSGSDADKETVRKQKRKLSFYSNIYVVKDPTNPQNEGRVFLYKYANFKLKIVKKDGYWNYDKSEFDRVTPLLDDDDALEAVWKKQYSLQAVIGADQFKSYEDLEKRLKYVLGQKSANRPRLDAEVEDEDNDRGSYTPDFGSRRQETQLPEDISSQLSSLGSSSSSNEDEDDALSYFQRLAEE
jgi:hypothetical protein